MLIDLLKNAGFSQLQAEVLQYLIEKGENKANVIAKAIQRPRGVVYRALDDMVALGLAEKLEKVGQVTRFRADHPSKIETIFEQRENEAQKQRQFFQETLPNLISSYNLAANKPGVRFFEGDEGIKTALYDTLTSRTEIYTYADIQAIEENLKEINAEYAKKRERQGVKKKIIVPNTEKNQKFFQGFNQETTEIKFIKKEYYPFYSGMQIYDNKISYQTLEKANKIAVIIDDRNIYQMHKLFFEYMWETLE